MGAKKLRDPKKKSTRSLAAATFPPLAAERAQFFEARIAASFQAAELRQLRDMLLAHGGTALVPPPMVDPDLPDVLLYGGVIDGKPKLMPGEPSNCHENVKRLWLRNPSLKMATGYGLSEDGLWRSHSWAMDGDRIIETTVKRLAYYGFVVPTGG